MFARTVCGLLLLAGTGGFAAVYDFSAPIQNIEATSSASTVSLRVVDPFAGVVRQTNISSTTFDLVSANGVAAWSSGNTVYCFIYVPALTNWVGNITTTGAPTFVPQTRKGLVAWTVGNTVHFRVYDQARAGWVTGSTPAGGTPTFLDVADGIAAWSTAAGVSFVVYDPARAQWVGGGGPIPVAHIFGQLVNRDGVVAWSTSSGATGGNVYAYTYDPTRTGWMPSASATGPTFDLTTASGVVAWSRDPRVYYQVYDPSRGQWIGSSTNSGFASNLRILDSAVDWNSTAGSFLVGYNPGPGQWQANTLPRPLAYFTVSTNAGNASLPVYFIDMSIGAATWNWNFGQAGATSTAQSPFFRYVTFNRYLVTLTVANGVSLTSSTNTIIRSDITAPTGTLLIDNGATIASNQLVTLRLTATDNSGVVSSNRLSNDNSTWSAWEVFSTNKVWTLTAGNGTKNVFVQYSDLAGNVSASASDSIQLVTNSPPVVTFVNTNVTEGAGTAMIQVVLSAAASETVWVQCMTANGTAIAGQDYTATAALLQFAPGTTAQIFPVPILQDTAIESAKTVLLQFGALTNAMAGSSGVLTILDDEPAQLTAPRMSGGQFQTTVLGAPGQRLAIQISSTLTNWTTLTTMTNTSGMVVFTDTTTTGVPVRFYRTLLLP